MSMGHRAGQWQLHAVLLTVWFAVSFGAAFFARDLEFEIAGWPVSFWLAAQGAVLVFVVVAFVFAWKGGTPADSTSSVVPSGFSGHSHIHRRFGGFVAGLLLGLLALAAAEQAGLSKVWVAAIFLALTLILYAAIGVYGRTAEASEYYVAGRKVPAVYNGMATAADWMSAASFISLAGGLYQQGFTGTGGQPGGLAYIMGWTGGFCLVAMWVAPQLRRMNLYTVPDYFAVRFGGRWPRVIAAWAAILVSFTYVVAQIYGVGLITSRLTGVHFEIGILLGLGGVLVCSFLGGMRAVTWTQVVQYVMIMLAFLVPVSWLSYQQTGNPFAPIAYGQQLPKIAELERKLMNSPEEARVRAVFASRAAELGKKLEDVESSLQRERQELRSRLQALGVGKVDSPEASELRHALAKLPRDADAAQEQWQRELLDAQLRSQVLSGMPQHTSAYSGDPRGTSEEQSDFEHSRSNFLALMFCLMIGTVGLPHLLTRFYTSPTVASARQSVAWSLLFIALLYLSAPALAVLVKYEVMAHLVGTPFNELPGWMFAWSRDPDLMSFKDINADGILQFAELHMNADVVMLASPEIGGLPYVISVLVAAGGLAAALSTADGLLLTIGNALAHDMYVAQNPSKQQAMRRVMWSKFTLLVVALLAAYVAAQRPAGILYLVAASFSLAGAAFVPVMVLGMVWKRTSRAGAVAGMLTGLGVTIYYLLINQTPVRTALGMEGSGLWWGIQPVSGGVFGVTAGLLVAIIGSWIRPSVPES